MTHGCYLAIGTFEGLLAEEVAGLVAELAADNVLVDAVVTVDAHVADVGLLVLLDAHLQVHAVAHDVHLHGVELVEEVAVVVVEVADGVVIRAEALLEVRLVVDVTLLHAQLIVEVCRRVERVSHPLDVADVVLLTFLHPDDDVDRALVVGAYAVVDDAGVAVAELVVLLDEAFLVLGPALVDELLGAEPAAHEAAFVGLLERTVGEERPLDFLDGKLLVAQNGDAVDLHLVLLVDVDVYDDLAGIADVVVLNELYLGVLVAFVVEVLLAPDAGTLEGGGHELHPLDEAELALEVLALAFLDAIVVDLRDAGPGGEGDAQVDAVANDAVCLDGDVAEEPVLPVALRGAGDFLARNGDALPLLKA